MFPVSSSLDFDATSTDVNYFTAEATFQVYCVYQLTAQPLMMDLEKIQEMWQKDSVIDPDNLHDESLKIPQLHSKYYTIYNTITLVREKARERI